MSMRILHSTREFSFSEAEKLVGSTLLSSLLDSQGTEFSTTTRILHCGGFCGILANGYTCALRKSGSHTHSFMFEFGRKA